MTTVRRSTRLSNIGREATLQTNNLRSSTRSRRNTNEWRTEQKIIVSDDDDDDDHSDDDAITSLIKNKSNRIANSLQYEENDENDDSINKPKTAVRIATTPKKMTTKHNDNKVVVDKRLQRPMPACKKRQLQQKIKESSNNDSDTEEETNCAASGSKATCNNVTKTPTSKPDISSLDVSPPKQARYLHKVIISPSRLIDRLSIDERKNDESQDEDINDRKELKSSPSPPRNKYQSARRVLNSAETQNLPGREEQLEKLREFFLEHLSKQQSGSLYVSGQPGTGKTACLSLLLKSREFSGRFQCAYLNCTSIASIGSVYKKLCSELKIKVSGRTEREYLEAIQGYLRKTTRMVLIVLDEIDQLCGARQSVLYTIFEWPALKGARLLLVGIANSLDLTDRALTRLNARCELKPVLMHFPPYTKQQIIDIFRSRLEEAGVLDIFPPVTIQLLAAKVSAVSGDVRRALDIGRRVVEIAEQQKRDGRREVNLKELELVGKEDHEKKDEALKPVQMKQVVDVLNNVYATSQNLDADIQESFPLQQKLMLCSLMLMLRKERNRDITIGRLHEVYRRVCIKRNIHVLDQAEFAGLVDLVETRGILRILRKKEPRLNKVQLQWDEGEVNAALCDKQLIASILDDVSCLSAGGICGSSGRK